jgi:hypothetical protein
MIQREQAKTVPSDRTKSFPLRAFHMRSARPEQDTRLPEHIPTLFSVTFIFNWTMFMKCWTCNELLCTRLNKSTIKLVCECFLKLSFSFLSFSRARRLSAVDLYSNNL